MLAGLDDARHSAKARRVMCPEYIPDDYLDAGELKSLEESDERNEADDEAE